MTPPPQAVTQSVSAGDQWQRLGAAGQIDPVIPHATQTVVPSRGSWTGLLVLLGDTAVTTSSHAHSIRRWAVVCCGPVLLTVKCGGGAVTCLLGVV